MYKYTQHHTTVDRRLHIAGGRGRRLHRTAAAAVVRLAELHQRADVVVVLDDRQPDVVHHGEHVDVDHAVLGRREREVDELHERPEHAVALAVVENGDN